MGGGDIKKIKILCNNQITAATHAGRTEPILKQQSQKSVNEMQIKSQSSLQ